MSERGEDLEGSEPETCRLCGGKRCRCRYFTTQTLLAMERLHKSGEIDLDAAPMSEAYKAFRRDYFMSTSVHWVRR